MHNPTYNFPVNEGHSDRVLRATFGVVLLASAWVTTGWWQWAGLIFGSVLLLTGLTGFCGLYALLGISTCPVSKTSSKKSSKNALKKTKNRK